MTFSAAIRPLHVCAGLAIALCLTLPHQAQAAGEEPLFDRPVVVITGIPELDALIAAGTSHAEGQRCYDEEEEGDPDCNAYFWFHTTSFSVTPVSSRMLAVTQHYSEADGGGPPYHGHRQRLVWGIREGRILGFDELVADPACLSERPGDDEPERQEMYDFLNDAWLEDVFAPTPEGFELWVFWSGLGGPGCVEYPLSALDFCGVRKEYWEHPTVREEPEG